MAFAVVVDARVAIRCRPLCDGAYARCKDIGAKVEPTAGVESQVGICGLVVVALARLGFAHILGRRATALVDRVSQLQLGKIDVAFGIGRLGLGENRGLASGDGGKAPASAPGVLELDRRDDAVFGVAVAIGVAQVVACRQRRVGGSRSIEVARGIGLVPRRGSLFGRIIPACQGACCGSAGRCRQNTRKRCGQDDGQARLKAVERQMARKGTLAALVMGCRFAHRYPFFSDENGDKQRLHAVPDGAAGKREVSQKAIL